MKVFRSIENSETHLDSVTTDEQSQQNVINNVEKLLSKMIWFAGRLAQEAYIQSVEEFNGNYRSLMQSLLKLVKDGFSDSNEHGVSESHMMAIRPILNLACNLTDKTSLVPMFVGAGYANTTIEWIKKPLFPHIIEDLGESIVGIVYNLSRHKKGLEALQEVRVFEVLIERKSIITEAVDGRLIEIFSMLLIAVSRSDDEQKQNEDLILDVSNYLIVQTKKTFDREDWRLDGCHLSEYLYSLQSAFSNTNIVRKIFGASQPVNKKNIQLFADMLCSVYGLLFNQDADDLEKLVVKSLLNIILCISNYKLYRAELRSHVFLSILIETLAKQLGQDVAKRIQCNLQHIENPKLSLNKSKKRKAPKIYVSYNWNDESFCKQFIHALRKYTKLPIWVDYENTNKLQDLWESAASAIDSAKTIIVLASTAYGQSKTNRQELTYAITNSQQSDEDQSIIVVNTVPGFKFNREWMNDLLGNLKVKPYEDKDIEKLAENVANHKVFSKYKEHSLLWPSSGSTTQSQVCTII